MASTARPTEPPIWRKNVRLDVATPRARIGTAFWTTIVNTASVGPMPRPVMNIQPHRTGSGVSAWIWDIRNRPKAMTASPARMTALYLPVRETIAPEPMELRIRPARSASEYRPEFVGEAPYTNWNHCGRNTAAPKKPKLIRNVAMIDVE